MKYIILNLITGFLMLCLPAAAWGQWDNGQATVFFSIPEVAIIDIEPGSNNQIRFSLTPASESGNSTIIEKSSDATLWINYSSALPASQISRSITAEVSQGQIPPGIQLFIEASQCSNGMGNCGVSTGIIELSNQPKPVISEIGNCYTGDGINSGHQLSFSIEISDYTNLKSTLETSFLVLYTLTDN